MFIQPSFRHPAAIDASMRVRNADVSCLIGEAQACAISYYRPDTAIYGQGDPAGTLYLVVTGTVRICQVTGDGRRQINSFHFPGEVFGFEAGAEHESYAESVDGAGIRVLRPVSGEGFGHSILKLALQSLGRTQHHLVLLGRMSAVEKMAAFLTDLLERQDSDGLLSLPMQRNDIADYLGLTFETVSRVLRTLKDRDLIRVPRIDQIEILDADALATLCE